ncbi:MAG: TolC family protein [Gemmatimonas sp.]
MRFSVLSLAVTCLTAAVVPVAMAQAPAAQGAVGASLSVDDAVALARRNNPAFQSQINARRIADNNARAATGAFLPSLSSSFGGGYRQGGTILVNGISQGAANDILSSQGSINANVGFSLDMLSNRKSANLGRDATEADISNAEQILRQQVVTAYIAVLAAEAAARLQDTILATTNAQLALARARLQVGTGIQLDVDNAEVADGNQRVAVLRAKNEIDIAKIRLYQQIGVPASMSAQLQPLPPLAMPQQSLSELLELASRSSPALESNRVRERQAGYDVTSAKRRYFPSIGVGTSVGGNMQRFVDTDLLIETQKAQIPGAIASCQRSEEVRVKLGLDNNYNSCATRFEFTAADEAALRDAQNKFPFGLQRQPYGFNVSLSLPIFNGFQRENAVANANVQLKNAQNTLRTQQLQMQADINSAWLNLSTQQQTVALQEQTARTARTALALAEEKYKTGSSTLLDLIQARDAFNRAETGRINAIFDFQRIFVQLEAAVGRPLR